MRPVHEAVNGRKIRQPLEVVVVDDGSADDAFRIASSLADCVVVESRLGILAARGRGLSVRGTEFIFSVEGD